MYVYTKHDLSNVEFVGINQDCPYARGFCAQSLSMCVPRHVVRTTSSRQQCNHRITPRVQRNYFGSTCEFYIVEFFLENIGQIRSLGCLKDLGYYCCQHRDRNGIRKIQFLSFVQCFHLRSFFKFVLITRVTYVSANFFFEDDMGRVEGKTAVITAAGQGIGRARFMMMIMTTMMTIMRRRRKRAYRY